jgi:hypothetical protein
VEPAVQALQTPFKHTWFVPHSVPLAAIPIATHVGVPVEHDIAPV